MEDNNQNIKKIIDDFNKKLLQAKENENLREVKVTKETEEKETDLATFVTKNKWQVYKEISNIFTERSKQDNILKEKYSKKLIRILIVQLIILNTIFILRGFNVVTFADTTFNIFIGATIAEIFSLVAIIVKYLFTDNLSNLLSNLLAEVKEDKQGKNK